VRLRGVIDLLCCTCPCLQKCMIFRFGLVCDDGVDVGGHDDDGDANADTDADC
jgi:hypothetical protein